jgi:heat shock protein HslJ
MHKRLKIIQILTLLMLLAAACNAADATPEGEWVLATLNGANTLPDVTVTLNIDGDSVSGFSGCNHFSGKADIKGRQIQLNELSMTLMACLDELVNQQEADFFIALNLVDTWQVADDRLTLSGGDWALEFTRGAP